MWLHLPPYVTSRTHSWSFNQVEDQEGISESGATIHLLVFSVLAEQTVLRTGRLRCVECNPGTRCTGSLAVPTGGMNELKKRKICYHCRGSHPSSSVVQPLAQSVYEFMSPDKIRCEDNVENNFWEIRKESEKSKFTCFTMVDFCEHDDVLFAEKSGSGTD
jgi:hypothetical protein